MKNKLLLAPANVCGGTLGFSLNYLVTKKANLRWYLLGDCRASNIYSRHIFFKIRIIDAFSSRIYCLP